MHMKITKTSFSLLLAALCILLSLSSNTVIAAEHPQLKAFPVAKPGLQRIVIVLPHKERSEEGAFQVELLPGKMMSVDGVNHFRVNAKIQAKPLKGWGYTYYDVTGGEQGISTKMGVPAGTQMIKSFVAGEPLKIQYNSRLPIVIYAKPDMQVRYRIWRADNTYEMAKQG